ncbi:MAG: hypothetical protein Q4C85_06535 [Actinomyces sp.]|uniref:hypothetical protein n=1 Tax=Actinomyces sp. TaxID=29317 RepID=UPI0026DAB5AB|nr:hypothetical protein [Actinomyces sp.]MDO4243401.1 hypothetical protein [Actinomyces sp.]
MHETSSSQPSARPTAPAGPTGPLGPAGDLSAEVDLGSWARFTPSLAAFLDGPARPGGRGAGLTVLLTAPAPVVAAEQAAPSRPLPGLRRLRRRREPSPEVPGVVLARHAEDVEVLVPVLDARGRVLLGGPQTGLLEALGWRRGEADLMRRRLPGGAEAADAVTRVLIEVLGVAHPADLDWLIDAQP